MLKNLHQTLSVEGASGRTYTLHQFSFDDFDDLKGTITACGGIYVFTQYVQDNPQTPIAERPMISQRVSITIMLKYALGEIIPTAFLL